MGSTVEAKGKEKLLADYYSRVWYRDFLDFVKANRIFATMCTPAGEGAPDGRWDTWRITEFAEILGFYGLQYWYTWQVSVLGLGPIWMSGNEAIRKRAAQALEDGGIFAFGLSEKAHGADIYSTDMVLTRDGDGFRANGRKYGRSAMKPGSRLRPASRRCTSPTFQAHLESSPEFARPAAPRAAARSGIRYRV